MEWLSLFWDEEIGRNFVLLIIAGTITSTILHLLEKCRKK